MLNRHGTRLDIGLEDIAELDLVEAKAFKQSRVSGLNTVGSQRLSSHPSTSSPLRQNARTSPAVSSSSGGDYHHAMPSGGIVSNSPLFSGVAESPSTARPSSGPGGGRWRDLVPAWEPRATAASSWESEGTRRSTTERSVEYHTRERNSSVVEDDEPRPSSRVSGILPR